MSKGAERRLARELGSLNGGEFPALQNQNWIPGRWKLWVDLNGDNPDPLKLRATVLGPEGTPYAGGTFEIEIEVPAQYPLLPPEVRFITKVYACNVGPTDGLVKAASLDCNSWSPSKSVCTWLRNAWSLLEHPDLDLGDEEIVRQYKTNRTKYDAQARDWTAKYAIPQGVVSLQAPSVEEAVDLEFPDGSKYCGSVSCDQKLHGLGKLRYKRGDVYVGFFALNAFHGRGEYTFINGDSYDGEWVEGRMCGEGKYTYANKDVFEGQYAEDKKHGWGKYTIHDGGRVFKGVWFNDEFVEGEEENEETKKRRIEEDKMEGVEENGTYDRGDSDDLKFNP